MEEKLALEMRNIRKTFPGVVALDEVNLELRKGEVHILLGENGAGKSTLMKILSGAYQKDGGQILLNGQEVEIRNPKQARELGIGIIYIVAAPWLGYLVSIAALILATTYYQGGTINRYVAVVAISGAVFFWLLFVVLMRIPQPPGWWPSLL